jgi:hypothetical protein
MPRNVEILVTTKVEIEHTYNNDSDSIENNFTPSLIETDSGELPSM